MFRLVLAVLATLTPVPVLAQQPPLGEVSQVTEGLIAAAIAYEIGDKCDPVDARMLRGLAYLNDLKAEARRLGYDDDAIDAFIDDEGEKDRLETVARDRLRAFGAVEGEWDTYCVVGRTQIAEDTVIGRLLAD